MTLATPTTPYKLFIFDLDGTLVRPKSGATFWQDPLDYALLPERALVCKRLREAGITLAVATNQGGVAMGHKTMPEATAYIDNVTHALGIGAWTACFTHPHGTQPFSRVADDPRRKPNPGMLLELMADAGASPQETLFVGDMDTDRQAAERAGCAYWEADEFFDWMAALRADGGKTVRADEDRTMTKAEWTADAAQLIDDMGAWIAGVVSADQEPWQDVVLEHPQLTEGERLLDRLNVLRGLMTRAQARAHAQERDDAIAAWERSEAAAERERALDRQFIRHAEGPEVDRNEDLEF